MSWSPEKMKLNTAIQLGGGSEDKGTLISSVLSQGQGHRAGKETQTVQRHRATSG